MVRFKGGLRVNSVFIITEIQVFFLNIQCQNMNVHIKCIVK